MWKSKKEIVDVCSLQHLEIGVLWLHSTQRTCSFPNRMTKNYLSWIIMFYKILRNWSFHVVFSLQRTGRKMYKDVLLLIYCSVWHLSCHCCHGLHKDQPNVLIQFFGMQFLLPLPLRRGDHCRKVKIRVNGCAKSCTENKAIAEKWTLPEVWLSIIIQFFLQHFIQGVKTTLY